MSLTHILVLDLFLLDVFSDLTASYHFFDSLRALAASVWFSFVNLYGVFHNFSSGILPSLYASFNPSEMFALWDSVVTWFALAFLILATHLFLFVSFCLIQNSLQQSWTAATLSQGCLIVTDS